MALMMQQQLNHANQGFDNDTARDREDQQYNKRTAYHAPGGGFQPRAFSSAAADAPSARPPPSTATATTAAGMAAGLPDPSNPSMRLVAFCDGSALGNGTSSSRAG